MKRQLFGGSVPVLDDCPACFFVKRGYKKHNFMQMGVMFKTFQKAVLCSKPCGSLEFLLSVMDLDG